MRGLMGSFTLMPLQEVVEFLARRRVTGALTCERGGLKKTCHIVEGAVVEAASNDPREYLGQLLLNFGHLAEEDLARAFEAQQETKVRLGKVLVAIGLVTPDVVRDTLALKIRETLLDAFLWESGLFYVEEGPPRPGDDLDPRVELAEICREAEFRVAAWQAFRAAFPSGATTIELDDRKAPRDVDAASVNGQILALARERRSVDEIALALHATDFHVYQRLYALWTQGLVRAAQERPQAPGASGAQVLLEDARAHLAAGRLAEAEEAAARAADEDPSLAGAAELRDAARERLARALRQAWLEPPRTPALQVPRHEISTLPLAAADKWLLAHCDGARDAAALVLLAPLGEIEVLKRLRRLADERLVAAR